MSADNVSAAESEATEEPRVIEHKGIELVIPAPLDFPLDVIEAENEVEVVRLVLGESQWAKYKATKPTIRCFQELSEKVNGSTGN